MNKKFRESVKFITMVRDRPALWDHAHHLNGDKIVCTALWENIGIIFDINVSAAKARWKNFRDNFRKELKKSPLRFSGTRAEEYNSSWRFFPHMFFYKDQIKDPFMSNGQDQLIRQFEPTPSSSNHSDNDSDRVEIVETTHDAFVREFPKPKPRKSSEYKELHQRIGSTDPDIGFLATLLPHLRAVSGNEKLILQNLLLKTIYSFLKNSDCDQILTINDSSDGSVVDQSVEEPHPTPRKKIKRKSSEMPQWIPPEKTASCENITIEE